MTPIAITRIRGDRATTHAWTIAEPASKLLWRSSLAGASTYDRAASTLRVLQARGAHAVDLLPLALPASWMVNAKATSRAMQRWLMPPATDAWAALLDGIAADLSPEGWLERPQAARDGCAQAVESLANGADGATLAAVTKVLALLRPQLVPLMDDAALWFALELVDEPTSADAPSADHHSFLPMLDWFAEQVIASEASLIAVAAGHDRAVLDAAQTLDRLLWVESWGHHLRA